MEVELCSLDVNKMKSCGEGYQTQCKEANDKEVILITKYEERLFNHLK